MPWMRQSDESVHVLGANGDRKSVEERGIEPVNGDVLGKSCERGWSRSGGKGSDTFGVLPIADCIGFLLSLLVDVPKELGD